MADLVRNLDLPWAWLSLAAADGDPVQLHRDLRAALVSGPAAPAALVGNGARADGSLSTGPHGAPAGHLALDLARALTAPPVERLLVLDDFDVVADPSQAAAFVRRLLAMAPDNVRAVVASRSPLPSGLAGALLASGCPGREGDRLEGGDVASDGVRSGAAWPVVVQRDDLAFDRESVERFLDQHAIPLADWPDVLDGLAACEGWPAAIDAGVRALVAERTAPVIRRLATRSTADALNAALRAFVECRLDAVAPADRAFVYRLAQLEHITPELCAVCLGMDDEGAGHRLDLLARSHSWWERGSDGRSYRIHPLVRSVLVRPSDDRGDALSPVQHRIAATWLRRQRATSPSEVAIDLAEVGHRIAGGDLDRAGDRMIALAPELARAGAWPEILALIHRWQDRAARRPPEALAHWQARAAIVMGDLAAARSAVAPAGGRAERAAPGTRLAQSHLRLAAGDADGAGAEAEMAWRGAGLRDPGLRVKALRLLGQSHAAELHLNEAAACFDHAGRLADGATSDDRILPADLALLWIDQAACAQTRGRVEEAIALARRAVAAADRASHPAAMVLARNNMGTACHLKGDYLQSRESLDAALAIARHAGRRREEAIAWLSMADLEVDAARLDAAERAWAHGLVLARAVGDPRLEAYAQRGIARLRRVMGQPGLCQRALTEASRCLPAPPRADRAQHDLAAGAWHVVAGDPTAARDVLEPAIAALSAGEARVDLVRGRAWRAYALFRAGGIADALPELIRLADDVAAIDRGAFVSHAAGDMPRLWGSLQATLRDGHAIPEDRRPALASLLGWAHRGRRCGADLPAPTTPPGAHMPRIDDPPPALLTPREREIVLALCEGLPREAIAARIGRSRSTLDKALSEIYASTGFSQAHQLVAWAFRAGIQQVERVEADQDDPLFNRDLPG